MKGLVTSLFDVQSLPKNYVLPPERRLGEVRFSPGKSNNIPVLDLEGHDRNEIIQQITKASQEFGFFQVRPPGHHAGVSQSMSFFLHNNAAVAALAAQAAGAKKVLIVDWVALTGNFKEAKPLLGDESDDHLSMLCTTITEVDETILHVATRARQVGFVEEIIKLMEPEDLKLQDRNGNTAFCFATAAGSIEIVKLMLDKNLDLLTLRGADNKVPLYMVALFGRTEMANFLYDGTESQLTDQDEDGLFFTIDMATLFK
ncbi:hypothetical protein LWI29_008463 [Acer saccharum]|uniref:Histone deacetylase domain-containing protein n=1 Tax=Acer saccharum TaxID=4024 RepID=A0AA39TJN0_ACESA|nr:hypothetical protein LWI29_008463 [Acer saccharum]